jgi:hypothetical protein
LIRQVSFTKRKIAYGLISAKYLNNKKRISPVGHENLTDSEDRKLQIKLAQLNADLQVYLATIFGAIAAAIALLVFGYQLLLESYPQLSIKTVVALIFFIVGSVMTYSVYTRTLPELKRCLDEFKNLQ